MKKTINNLQCSLKEIISQGWIKGCDLGHGSAGLTLEKLLKIPNNNFEIPDYNGIELKTKSGSFSEYITLFNISPDSILFSAQYLKDHYGYPDKDFAKFKVFNLSFDCKNIKYTRDWKFIIKTDYESKIVQLMISDKYGNFTDNSISWTFESIEEKLLRKLKYLAMVSASNKVINKEKFFKYNNFKIYKLTTFEKFLELLEQGKIRITFKIGIFKSGKRFGQTHFHGVGFELNYNAITELFEKIRV